MPPRLLTSATHIARLLRRYRIATGTLTLLLSAAVLTGWKLGVPALTSVVSGWVTMKPNTALALGLIASSLLLHERTRRRRPAVRLVAHTLGIAALAIGAATLVEYATTWNVGLDEMIVSVPHSAADHAPARMSVVAGFIFVLLGAAAALVETRWRAAVEPLTLTAAAVSIAALLGHLYGSIAVVGAGHGIQIAPHTAAAALALATALAVREAGTGWLETIMSRRAGGALARRLLPFAVLIPVGIGVARHIGAWTGFDQQATDDSLVAVATMIAFAVVVWRAARALNDADDRARLAREKEDALALLDQVLESAPSGIGIFDEQRDVVRLNSALARALPDVGDLVKPIVEDVWRTGDARVNEEIARPIQGVLKGNRHWVLTAYPVRDTAGQAVAVGLTIDETTARKRLEEQLGQSQRMEAVGQLAGGVAHDFNNVLTVITGYSSLLMHQLTAESPVRDDIAEISTAANRGAALTRQLLAFSRQQILHPQRVDVNEIVAGLQPMLRRLIASNIRMTWKQSPLAAVVMADPGQLEQVVVNLVVNARDAMSDGGDIFIQTGEAALTSGEAPLTEDMKGGRYVVLTVSDTGMGMDEKTRARIFEPFFTTKEKGKGTGLGLSTVYGIVRQSGGTIWTYSEPGRGTTFKIYLPADGGLAVGASDEPSVEEELTGSGTILLVEDDPAVRATARRLLEHAGYTTIEATNGREALDVLAVQQGRIDAVLTDIVMPELSGGELGQVIKALWPNLPVVYMSGYSDDVVSTRELLARDAQLVEKPFSGPTLIAALRRGTKVSQK